ncbi:MAG: hydrogenase maturation nickel metallochaperone HypA [Firmicutes bacterium]|nr:hydrogenase maturation nickel metallochaperone HypA [Bacillota bacterium]
MHEMSYVVRLAELALKAAEKEGLASVSAVYADIGKMTGIVPYYMQKYYKLAAKGTILENSVLVLTETEVLARCEGCGSEYTPSAAHDYLCPVCGRGNCRIIAGRGVTLSRLEGESKDEH